MAATMGERPMEAASLSVLVALVLAVGLAGLLSGCAHLIPTGRIVDEDRFLGAPAAPLPQSGDPAATPVVLPFPIFGLHFDEELVLEVLDHPTWRMIEIVRLQLPERSVWFTLDSHRCGRQWVGVPEGNEAYASGFPAPTYPSDLEVERTATDQLLRYEARWTMQTGERIEVKADTPLPLRPVPLRNGNAMNHSQETALAVLDLEARRPAKVAASIDGGARRVSALSRGILVQTAAGLMAGARTFRVAEGGGIVAETEGGGTPYRRETIEGGFDLVAELPLSTERWRFVERDGAAHLGEVVLEGTGDELMRMRFNPPLPDLRVPVTDTTTSRVTMSIHGLPGYMSAEVHVAPSDGGTEVRVEPLRPRWARRRPVLSLIRFAEDGGVEVETRIQPTRPWSFGDVPCP